MALQLALDQASAGGPKPGHVVALPIGLALGWLLARAGVRSADDDPYLVLCCS